MSALFILVISSIVVAGGFLAAFLWSVRDGQYEDQQGSSWRSIYDDEPVTTIKQ